MLDISSFLVYERICLPQLFFDLGLTEAVTPVFTNFSTLISNLSFLFTLESQPF